MSWSRQVTIFCDGCGNWDQESSTVARLRKFLVKTKGWSVVVEDDGQVLDYCPACAEARRNGRIKKYE